MACVPSHSGEVSARVHAESAVGMFPQGRGTSDIAVRNTGASVMRAEPNDINSGVGLLWIP